METTHSELNRTPSAIMVQVDLIFKVNEEYMLEPGFKTKLDDHVALYLSQEFPNYGIGEIIDDTYFPKRTIVRLDRVTGM